MFSIIVWQISWPYLYNCTPIMYSDNIFFVGQNILLLNVMVSICSYRNLGFSIWINMCLCMYVLEKVVSGNMTSTKIACGLVYIACLFLQENVQNVLISILFLGNNQTTTITETNPQLEIFIRQWKYNTGIHNKTHIVHIIYLVKSH